MDDYYSYDSMFSGSPGNRPHYHRVPDYWDHILKGNEYRVFQFLYFHISDIVASNSHEVNRLRRRVGGGVWCMSDLIAKRTGLSVSTVDRALAALEKTGLIIRVNRPEHKRFELRRVFFINHPLLARLDKAWMSVQTKTWFEKFETYEDYEDALQHAVEQEWAVIKNEGLENAVRALKATCSIDMGVSLILTGTPGHFDIPTKIDTNAKCKEACSSNKPGVSAEDDGNPKPPAAPTGGQDRASSLPATFRRKPVLAQQEKPSPQALDASLEHAIGEVANHWNSKGTLGKAVRRRRGAAADFKYFTTFATAMKTILGGTFFKGRAKVDAKYIRAYSVAEIKRAIDILAEYPDSIRKNVGNIGDFFWWDNPKTNGFNSGTGQSWFLRALFGDDPRQPVVKQDDYPDVTAYLIQKYNETFLRGNSRDFVPREMNHFINAAARAVEVYQKNEDSLACLGKGPEYICSTLVACLREWGKGENGFSASPGHLVSDSLFTKAIDVMTKNGYIRSRATNDKRDEYTPEYDVVSGCVVVPEAPPMTEEEKIQHDNYIKAMKWPVKVRKVMMERYGIPLDTPGIFFEEVMEDADTEQE